MSGVPILKGARTGGSSLCLLLLFVFMQAVVLVAQTNPTASPVDLPIIKTNFVPEAVLTTNEIKQVIELARMSGIQNAGEVSTFHFVPSIETGIQVKSVDRVDGRNTSFDSILITRHGPDAEDPGNEFWSVGEFRAFKTFKRTTLLRKYEFRGAAAPIQIGEGLDVAIADKVIPRIGAGLVRFKDVWLAREFDQLKSLKPTVIHKGYQGSGYELRFDGEEIRSLHFNWDDGRVVITGVSQVVF